MPDSSSFSRVSVPLHSFPRPQIAALQGDLFPFVCSSQDATKSITAKVLLQERDHQPGQGSPALHRFSSSVGEAGGAGHVAGFEPSPKSRHLATGSMRSVWPGVVVAPGQLESATSHGLLTHPLVPYGLSPCISVSFQVSFPFPSTPSTTSFPDSTPADLIPLSSSN